MASAGWYPDPGNSGKFRFWDGLHWSASLSDTQNAPFPGEASAMSYSNSTPTTGGATSPHQLTGSARYVSQHQPGHNDPTDYDYPADTSKRTWWVVGGVVVLALLVALGFGMRSVLFPGGPGTGDPDGPFGTPDQVCPPQSRTVAPVPAQSIPGRVTAGNLSYPTLPGPWGPPTPESRVPFAEGQLAQNITVHRNYAPGSNWVASVTLASLYTGDGFYEPKRGAEIVVKCVTGTFYGDNTDVTRKDLRSEATTVDGHEAWVIEADLSFDIANLPTRNELLIVIVVDTQDGGAGLLYASIPGDTPQYVQGARAAIAGLRVER